jgi:hypothetical protein
MRKRWLPIVIVSVPLVTAVCGEGEEVFEPAGPFAALAACTGDCFGDLGKILDGMFIILKEADDPPNNHLPLGYVFDIDTGEFRFDLDLDSDPGPETGLRGTLTPLEECTNGLQQHDVCLASWATRTLLTGVETGSGVFSIIDHGLTNPPNQTESFRITIVQRNPTLTSENCDLEITIFDLGVHPQVAGDELQSAHIGFVVTTDGSRLEGTFLYGPGMGAATVTGTYDGAPYSCTLDLDSWTMSC